MNNDTYIRDQFEIPASANATQKPLHYYLIQYHDGCLLGDTLSARLMRSYTKGRAAAYDTRLQGLYDPDGFKPHEDNSNNYFALIADANNNVLSGARAGFSTNQKDLPYDGTFGSAQLDAALSRLQSHSPKPLVYCEYGGVFTDKTKAGGKGLAKLCAKHLYKFIQDQHTDIIFIGAFSDLLRKYLSWAPDLGMKQMYLLPENDHEKGMLMLQTTHTVETLNFPDAAQNESLNHIDGLSTKKADIYKRDQAIQKAEERQHGQGKS